MNTTTTTRSVRFRDHTVIGHPDHIANVIANHRHAGTLLATSAPVPVDPGRVAVKVRLRETTPAPPPRPALPGPPRPRTTGRHQATPAAYTRPPADAAHPLTIRVRPGRTRHHRRTLAIAAAIGMVGAVLALAAYLLAQLVALIATHAAVLAGILAAALLLVAAVRGSARTRGRHCPGCN